MQENALHGWRLADGQHMRMSGYPAKTEALSFTRRGKWLASSGADAMVLWPFHGGGPMGKAPLELAGGDGVICRQVAAHPTRDYIAGGFADGLVVVADAVSPASPAMVDTMSESFLPRKLRVLRPRCSRCDLA